METIVGGGVVLGLLAFAAWTVRVFVTTELRPKADPTSVLIYRAGQACIWLAALALAGGILGTVARLMWRMLEEDTR
jgi:hypothetical protein